ncbi:MAG: AbgT family transporter, partial [Bacilli bacterium]
MKKENRRGFVMRSLDGIEKVGNRLPDPTILFVYLTGLVVLASFFISKLGIEVNHPTNPDEVLSVTNLLSADGIQYMFESMVTNFTGFAPLGTVLVTMFGIGIAERSGLIGVSLKGLVLSVPTQLVTATLVFAGIMSSMASDAGYVVLTPLGGVIFAVMGRHPLAGIAAAFAGVSGGYSANL